MSEESSINKKETKRSRRLARRQKQQEIANVVTSEESTSSNNTVVETPSVSDELSTSVEPKLSTKRIRRRRRQVKIDEVEGISVGTRLSLKPEKPKRSVRDRRRERRSRRLARKEKMKLLIDGQEKEIPETSKYFLDMLIPENKEE